MSMSNAASAFALAGTKDQPAVPVDEAEGPVAAEGWNEAAAHARWLPGTAKDVPPPLPSRPPRRWYGLLGLSLAVLATALSSLSSWQTYQSYESQALKASAAMARTMQIQLRASLDATVMTLETAALEYSRELARQRPDPGVFNSFLTHLQALHPQVQGLRVANAQGQVLYGESVNTREPERVEDQAFFTEARNESESRAVFVGPLYAEREQRWFMVVARRLNTAQGDFAGVVYTRLGTQQLGQMFGNVQVGLQDVAELRTEALALVYRQTGAGKGTGAQRMPAAALGSKDLSPQWSAAIRSRPADGQFMSSETSDGVLHSNAYRKLGPYPFYVLVGLNQTDAWREMIGQVLGTGLLGLVITLLALLASYQFYRLHAGSTRLARQHAQRAQISRTLLETASDGLHVLNGAGELVRASDSFCNMLGYSHSELKGLALSQWDTQVKPGEEQLVLDLFFKQPEPSLFETQHRRRDGSTFDVEVSVSVVRIAQRSYLYCASRDISPRKRMTRKLQESEKRLRDTLDHLPAMVAYFDSELVNQFANDAFHRWLQLPAGSLVGKSIYQLLYPDLMRASQHRLDAVLRGEVQVFEDENQVPGQPARQSLVQYVPRQEDGQVAGFYVMITDISSIKQAEEALRLSMTIYQSSPEAIMVTDENNRVLDVNPAFERITGYSQHEMLGQSPALLQSGRHDKSFYASMWRQLLEKGHWNGEIWNRRKNGEAYAEWLNVSVMRSKDGRIHRYVAQFSDITDRKRMDDLVWRQAHNDPLTGLPNRRLFKQRLGQAVLNANGQGHAMALLFLDLDHFKDINDSLGHGVGDRLLQQAAERLTLAVREGDTVARIGGDEFAVIVPLIGEEERHEKIAHTILRSLRETFVIDAHKLYISASIGITLYPQDPSGDDDLIRHADQAMYQAKSQGRSRFAYYTSEMQAQAQQNLYLTNELHQAFARGELALYFQPIVDLASGQIRKAEVLLRWNHPERGPISPGVFIPLAERSGLIVDIGDWVFDAAVSQIEHWRERYGEIIPLNVNQSVRQFVKTQALPKWQQRLLASGLPGRSITVEITESLLMNDSELVRSYLLGYRQQGIEVSIDDFGTGFSSLSYLNRFEIDYIKIDKAFTLGLERNENDRVLTEAIIMMARKLGIRTIAEGVETQAQRDILRDFQCDMAQGHFYAPALRADDFERRLDLQFEPRADASRAPAAAPQSGSDAVQVVEARTPVGG